MNSRKTFLYNEKTPWIKKSTNDLFDVPMGSRDGAECCEVIGLYMLSKMCTLLNKESNGIYRDDGLIVIAGKGRDMDVMRKK